MIESWGMSQPVQINVMKYSGFFSASVQFCVQFHKDILILKHVWYNGSLIGITWDFGLSHLKVPSQELFTKNRGVCLCGRGHEQVCRSARSCTEPCAAQLYRHFLLCLSLYSAPNIALQSTLASNVSLILW